MNFQNFKEYLLNSIPNSKPASGGTFVTCRCFYCPDGKSANTRHFYIKIPQNSNEVPWYYCHKCHATSVVTHKTLIEWGIYDQDIAIDLANYIKQNRNNPGYRRFNSGLYYKINNLVTRDDNSSNIKLKYISSRIGYDFTFEELRDLKIVLNLNDILLSNQIQKLTRSPEIVQALDQYFVGFLSIDNAFFNMRRICKSGILYEGIDKRYINYKIFDKVDNSERFYTIPTRVDLTVPERVKIHIAEGPFDILSIYKNLRKGEPGIYTSVGGSNYIAQCIYFPEKYKIPLVEYHLYPDNDKYGSNDVMSQIAYSMKFLNTDFYIHRNMYEGEKDFGVPLDRIREVVYKI